MIRYYKQQEKHYSGMFKNKHTHTTTALYGCGEVTGWEWIDADKGEVLIKIEYLTVDPIIYEQKNAIFSGIPKQRKETFKEKLLGKHAPPNLPFEIGDMIVFEGYDKVYNGSYLKHKNIDKRQRIGNKAIVLNHLKSMDKIDAIDWVDKMLDEDKFESLYYQQLEEKANGFKTKQETKDSHKNIDDINKSIENFSDNKNSMNEKTNNKDNTKNENNKYSNDLDEIDKKIDELQKSFENEINKLNQQKDKVIQKIEKTKNLDKNNKSIENNVNENIQNNEKNIGLERER